MINEIKEIRSDRLKERVFEATHKTGLKIFYMPKPGFSKTYAVYGAKFGSVDTRFSLSGKGDYTDIPNGMAHFLEHKLFENEDGNAFDLYSQTGASANAYTSFDKTAYLFSCTDKFEQSLKILLSFVQKPYFTKESIENEQGIIGQEIRMYDDDPGTRVLMNLLEALYHSNPVRIDIAGTVESISEINDDILYKCFNTFYHPQNMALCIAGDQDFENILSICDKLLEAPSHPFCVDLPQINEPDGVARAHVEQKLAVSKPLFHIGFKDTGVNFSGKAGVLNEAVCNIALQMLIGRQSPLYEELYSCGIINSDFETEFMTGRGFGVSILAGESELYNEIAERFLRSAEKMAASPDPKLFELCKKSLYGKNVRVFNSTDAIANELIACYFNESSLFDPVDVFENIDISMVTQKIRSHYTKERMSISIINPT